MRILIQAVHHVQALIYINQLVFPHVQKDFTQIQMQKNAKYAILRVLHVKDLTLTNVSLVLTTNI